MNKQEQLTKIYRELVVEYGRNPAGAVKEFSGLPGGVARNTGCGDMIEVAMTAASGKVQCCYRAEGCALLFASASVLVQTVNGLELATASKLIRAAAEYFQAVERGDDPGAFPLTGDPGRLLEGASFFPARIRCVLLPWKAAAAALETA